MIKHNLKNQKGLAQTCFKGGFTLLEALVAISILMVAVAAPITIAQKGLSSAVYSKNQMIASYLAQDAIEYIKNKRDEVVIKNKGTNLGWSDLDIFSSCFEDAGCEIDTLYQGVSRAVSESSDRSLYLDDNPESSKYGLYGYEVTGTTETNFIRNIKMSFQGSDNDEVLVTVTVSWGPTEEVSVETLIFNY